jgi:hypothetical protein
MVLKCSYYFFFKSVVENVDNKLKVKLVKIYTLAFCVMRWKPACNFNWLDVGKMFRDCSHVQTGWNCHELVTDSTLNLQVKLMI